MATALITGSYGGLGTELVNIHAATGGDVILVAAARASSTHRQHRLKRTTA